MRKGLILAALSASAIFAQGLGVPVNQVATPPPQSTLSIYDYNGGSNLTYVGVALSNSGQNTITVSAASNANPVSFTATSHGFDFQSGGTSAAINPAVCISGATGNWTAINGCFVATPTSANAFTIAVDSTTFGALTGTLVVTTLAPLTSKAVWSIQRLDYDASNHLIRTSWAVNPGGAGAKALPASSTAMQFIWTSRSTYGYQ